MGDWPTWARFRLPIASGLVNVGDHRTLPATRCAIAATGETDLPTELDQR